MAERFFAHIGITLIFSMFMGVAALTMFFGIYLIAIPAWIVCGIMIGLQFRERKLHQVKSVRSAQRANHKANYSVLEEGDEAMREHLRHHPQDYNVALTLARSISKYRCNEEGKRMYELAAGGSYVKEPALAIDILREYLVSYQAPFDHVLTCKIALAAEQHGESHFATEAFEAVFNDPLVPPEIRDRALKECIRICKNLGLDEAASMYNERLTDAGE